MLMFLLLLEGNVGTRAFKRARVCFSLKWGDCRRPVCQRSVRFTSPVAVLPVQTWRRSSYGRRRGRRERNPSKSIDKYSRAANTLAALTAPQVYLDRVTT